MSYWISRAFGTVVLVVAALVLRKAPPGPERRFALWVAAMIAVIVVAFELLVSWLEKTSPNLSWVVAGLYVTLFCLAFVGYLRRRSPRGHGAEREEHDQAK